jgi:hypothetical protein
MSTRSSLPDLGNSFLKRYNLGSGDLCIAQGLGVLKVPFDFDVYLPSRGINLQRPFVWNLEQKRALIESVIVRRSIPPISVVLTADDVYQVIDGKQRLSAFIEYAQGLFDFCGYYCDDLPAEYLGQIKRHFVCAYRLCEHDTPITDDEKIEWFRWINFTGTPQDEQHMQTLMQEKRL